jgi:hypothetical protein
MHRMPETGSAKGGNNIVPKSAICALDDVSPQQNKDLSLSQQRVEFSFIYDANTKRGRFG